MKITLFTLLLSTQLFAIDYKCHDQALKKLIEFSNEYSGEKQTKKEFLKVNDPVFICKSKKAPHIEIYQYGDGSGLMGVEYKIVRGRCVMTEAPYAGQDDQDLDVEWANSFCQEDFSGFY